MSVRYTTRIGYGFVISREEFKDHGEVWPELEDSEFYFPIDSWENFPNIFFGFVVKEVAIGEAIGFNNTFYYEADKFQEMVEQYQKICPNKDNYNPKLYILSCID